MNRFLLKYSTKIFTRYYLSRFMFDAFVEIESWTSILSRLNLEHMFPVSKRDVLYVTSVFATSHAVR